MTLLRALLSWLGWRCRHEYGRVPVWNIETRRACLKCLHCNQLTAGIEAAPPKPKEAA